MIVKTGSVAQLLAVLALVAGGTTINLSSSSAQSSSTKAKPVSFICGKSNNVPATIARTPRGDVAVIRWASGFFSGAGFTPEKRCQEVSSRFQTYHNNGTLKYLTTGRLNNQPVICTAQQRGSACTDVLFTLEPEDNPNQVLRQLLSIRSGATTRPLSRSGSSPQRQVYINLDEYLSRAPVEPISLDSQTSEVPTQNTSQPDLSNGKLF